MSRFVFAILVGWVICHGGTGRTQQLTAGSGDRYAREHVLAAMPLAQLTPATQERIVDVIQRASLYRHLPRTAIQADPEYLTFLSCYPEVIVEIWRLMEVTQMSATRTAPFSLQCSDGEGTVSKIDLIYASDKLQIFLGEGSYEGPLLRRRIRGDCLIVLRTEHGTSANGAQMATCDLDIFLKIDNATAGFIAKTLHPLVGRTADQNFVETMKFVERLNETTWRNGPGVQGMAQRLTGLTPEVRDAFIEVAGVAHQRHLSTTNSQGSRAVVGATQAAPASPYTIGDAPVVGAPSGR